LARHPDRVEIVVEKMLTHFLAYPDPSGFKAQLVGVDRMACVRFKDALDAKLKARGLPPQWSDVIISEGQNDDGDLARFHYGKQKQDDLIDYFKLTPQQWEAWNREAFGEEQTNWRPPLKILIVCDRLLTGFDAPVEQVMYLDKPLRDHNLLQAIARTNRPLPAMDKRTGVVVDYFGVFANLAKALNFDENIREEALIDWEALKATVPGEVARCMESFKGVTIADTRECLLSALRAIKDPDAAKIFEHNFKSLERLWEAVSPDPCLYDHRYIYNWLCSIYIAHRRRQRGAAKRDTFGELSAKTRELIEQNTTFMDVANALPVFKIDKDYITKLDELPSAADKAAALEAMLTAELSEDDAGLTYRQLGERLARLKAKKDAADQAEEKRLKALQEIADEKATADEEPGRLGLTQSGEYAVFTILREHAARKEEAYLNHCARQLVAHLRDQQLLLPGWSSSKGGRMRVEQSMIAELWNADYAALGFPANGEPFVGAALSELVNSDGTS
jgi:type I restriction enzyme R subunit